MQLEDLTTIDQLTDFLSGTQVVAFSVISDRDACYHPGVAFPGVLATVIPACPHNGN